MRVLIACEYSGSVRDAFTERGYDATSCDILPCATEGKHIKGDVRKILKDGWDLMIAHPPCTYLSASGMHRTSRGLRDPRLTEDALEFVFLLMAAPIPFIAIENPVSVISTRLWKPDQVIQPYNFGDDASKKTCLWLKDLPLLKHTAYYPPTGRKNGSKRWGNQDDNGQCVYSGKFRALNRAKTYEGIAAAMADQWGAYVSKKLKK